MPSVEEMEQLEKEAVKYFYNLRATIDESNKLFGEDIKRIDYHEIKEVGEENV